MIGTICSALGVSRAVAWLGVIGAVLVIALAGFLTIHHDGERAGAAKVIARVEQAHTIAVADARHDERAATDAGSAIATSVAQQTVGSAAVTHHILEDLQHAINAVPPPVSGAALPAAPVDSLRHDLNDGIADANRAAEAADALP